MFFKDSKLLAVTPSPKFGEINMPIIGRVVGFLNLLVTFTWTKNFQMLKVTGKLLMHLERKFPAQKINTNMSNSSVLWTTRKPFWQ